MVSGSRADPAAHTEQMARCGLPVFEFASMKWIEELRKFRRHPDYFIHGLHIYDVQNTTTSRAIDPDGRDGAARDSDDNEGRG